jgi:hypothetical protein
MPRDLYRTIKGVANASLETPTGRLLVMPTAAGAVFNPGIEVQTIEGASHLGETVVLDTYPMAAKPEVKLDWKTKNLTSIGMRLGKEFKTQTGVEANLIANGLLVTRNSYAGAASSTEGHNLSPDLEGSRAFLLNDDDSSTPLTRQPFASFVPATPMSFAQGPDAAMKFSDDLLGKYVSYNLPQDLATAVTLSEDDFSSFALNVITILTDRTILQWKFPSVSVKLEDGEIDLTKPEMSISFRVQDNGSDCVPYKVIYKGKHQRRACIGAAAA